MNAPTLYALADEYRADLAKLADLDLDDETIADTLESMGGELQVKATNVAAFAAHLDGLAGQMKDAEKRMKARREAVERRAERMRHYLLHSMQHAGIQRIESPEFTLSIKANPAAVEVYEPGLIPAEFLRQPEPPPPTPDKAAIKAAIKAGKEVPGAKLTQGVRLAID